MTEGLNAFFGINIKASPDLKIISRKTDSLFDWLGDCGGFMEGLNILGRIFIYSYSQYTLESFLALNLVRFIPSKSNEDSDQQGITKAKKRK